MVKIAILMRRRVGLAVEDFQNHLRNRYGPLAARGPGLRRYVQSCALPQGYSKGDLLSMPSARCGSIRSMTTSVA